MTKGYRINDFAEYYRVTTFELPQNVPMSSQLSCSACTTSLESICTLVGYEGQQQMRVGGCPTCGYIGYIDRPSKEWIVNFYSSTWDIHTALSLEEVKKFPTVNNEKKSNRIRAATLATELPIDRSRSMLEIGCGYGNVLRYFRDVAGFHNVVGVENSSHRAKSVTDAFDIPVAAGNFEGDDVQQKLKDKAPFGLIFSHHVLEHVYNPAEFISAASKLQNEGDYLVLAVPNVEGEHAGYVTLYLPHLHSFSSQSLDVLLNRFGYEIVKHDFPAPENMIVVAQRKKNPQPHFERHTNNQERMIQKLDRGLCFSQDIQKPSTATWLVAGNTPDDMKLQKDGKLAWFVRKGKQWLFTRTLKRYTSSHQMLLSPVSEFYTQSPFEIQFPRGITVLMK